MTLLSQRAQFSAQNSPPQRASIDPLFVVCGAALVVGIAGRIFWGGDTKLWLDETFTGAIAAEPDWRSVFQQILIDVNAPGYYLIAHAWAQVAGLSNAALRFPALLFGLLAPLLCLWPSNAVGSARTRWLWCALIALAYPGLHFSQEARGYTLLMLGGVINTILFARLLVAPTTGRAAAWAASGALLIIVHYFAWGLAGLQGLVYLALWRGRALKTWPAALVFAPLFAWMAVHLKTILSLVRPELAWYSLIEWDDLPGIVDYLTGAPFLSYLLVACTILFFVRGRMESRAGGPSSSSMGDALAPAKWPAGVVAAVTALVGVCIIIAIATQRPILHTRYLTAYAPAIALGVAIWLEWLHKRVSIAPLAAVAIAAVTFGKYCFADPNIGKERSWQTASDAIMRTDTDQVVFYWDDPNNPAQKPEQLKIVGGFFFNRAGHPMEIAPFRIDFPIVRDPNPDLVALATKPNSVILWVYFLTQVHTAAKIFKPAIEAVDPSFKCRNFGKDPYGVLACRRGGWPEAAVQPAPQKPQ